MTTKAASSAAASVGYEGERALAASAAALAVEPKAAYRALVARDARFDGRFFVGVRTTGIYCRPVCRVRTPLERNCVFHISAAAAEAAGFRPCLRCRPELAPAVVLVLGGQRLAEVAARLIEDRVAGGAATDPRALLPVIAARVGVGERHLRRLFVARFGVSPVSYAQTQRLLLARRFLLETRWTIGEIAIASGFASRRRMNDLFSARYGMPPRRLRSPAGRASAGVPTSARFMVHYRPPYDMNAMFNFLADRAIAGIESVETGKGQAYRRTLRVGPTAGGATARGVVEVRPMPSEHALQVEISAPLAPHIAVLLAAVRRVFDTGADPQAIGDALGPLASEAPGLRLPGAFDPFELAVRAILGQQVTVKAARTLTNRFVAAFGEELADCDVLAAGLCNRTFPAPARVAALEVNAIAALGILRTRAKAIVELARQVVARTIDLSGLAAPDAVTAQLKTIRGVGPWTAHYIAMRALSWPDVWLPGDVIVHKVLGLPNTPTGRRRAQHLSAAWAPWRSYAVLHLWRRNLPAQRQSFRDSEPSP